MHLDGVQGKRRRSWSPLFPWHFLHMCICICVYAKNPHVLAASQCKICCKLLSVYKKTFAQLCVCVCLRKASQKLPNAQLQQLCPEVLPFSTPCPSFYLFIFLF